MAAALPRPTPVSLPTMVEPEGPVRGDVAFLPGCIAHTFFGFTNRNAVRLLARAGLRVHVPRGAECCGALLLHLGRHDEATGLAARTAEALRRLPARLDAVVTSAAGCGAMLDDYDTHLGQAALAAPARDVTSMLAEAGLPPAVRPLGQSVTYHDPCHLAHAQGVREAPRTLLREIPGLRLIELPEADTCCGSAGTYNLTEPGMARRLAVRKIEHILETGASVVTTPNPGCLVQIQAGLLMQRSTMVAAHPVDLLAAAFLPANA